ncbi:MAG: TM2 domain-containing protein [Urechidicola sp.]|nr:TM2 domain-containing protein [Urechidicola sp.]
MAKFPKIVLLKLNEFSEDEKRAFLEEYRRKKKSTVFAYILLFIPFGWHYAYLGKWGIQILYFFTWGGFLIVWFVDLFRLAFVISNYNKDVAIKISQSMK